jgi:hypothetical protein
MTTPDLAGLCERLRADADSFADQVLAIDSDEPTAALEREAAAAIERLSAENEALTDKVLDAAAAYLINTYGSSYGLDNEIDRARIKSHSQRSRP